MRRLALLILIVGIPSVAAGEVSTRVCLADGNTPFPPIDPNFPHVYPDIMVGTKLTIIVSSDTAENFWGGLIIEGTNLNYGALSARDYNEFTLDWEGSRFEAAGTGARVYTLEESGKYGFQLLGHSSAVAGDWFIIDYNSINVDDCNVAYYDYNINLHDPNLGAFVFVKVAYKRTYEQKPCLNLDFPTKHCKLNWQVYVYHFQTNLDQLVSETRF